ncbi:MAG: Hsp20/alpha crystallin family protein [Bacteriovoracia bacterium]
MPKELSKREESSSYPRNWLSDFWSPGPFLANWPSRSFDNGIFYPTWDFDESENEYMLYLDLPGISKENISVECSENELVISGERKHEEKRGKRSERYYGKFERRFILPTNVESEKLEADFKDGVLEICIPKTKQSKSRKIEIH